MIIYDEKYRTMIFKTIEDIKRIQANEAQHNAQARQIALGYNNIVVCEKSSSSSSACSDIAPPLPFVVANNIFDRGVKRKTSGPKKDRTRKKINAS